METINEFKGNWAFLSNFYYAHFYVDEIGYATMEHWYQSHKTECMLERAAIVAALSPYKAKQFGRKATLIPNFDSVKDEIMLSGLLYKFKTLSELSKRLIDTGDTKLIEGNYWNDTYWGVCLKTGKGENKLGELLMKVRDTLKSN